MPRGSHILLYTLFLQGIWPSAGSAKSPYFRPGREGDHPRKLQPNGLYSEIHFCRLAALNLNTESASGSVDGRVRGHDVVDGSLHPASKRR